MYFEESEKIRHRLPQGDRESTVCGKIMKLAGTHRPTMRFQEID